MADDPKPKAVSGSPAPPAVASLSDEEYANQFANSLKKPDAGPSPVKSLWDRFNGVMSKELPKPSLKEIGRSAARGVVDAAAGAVQTITEGAAAVDRHTGLGEKIAPGFNESYDALGGARGVTEQFMEPAKANEDKLLGKRSDDPLASFTEGATNFIAGFAAFNTGILKGHGAIKALAKGALTDATTMEPYEAQLAELAARTNVPGLKHLGEVLSVQGDDSPIVARLKRAAAGAIPGVVLDGVVAGARQIKAVRALKAGATGAEKSAAEATLESSAKVLKDIDEGTHVPEGSHVQVKEVDGGFTIEHGEQGSALEGVKGSETPVFQDKAEAVQQAASMDYAIQDRLDAGKVEIDHDALHTAFAQGALDEEPITVSSHNTVEQDLELVKSLTQSIVEKRTALEATTGGSITIEQGKELAKEMLERIPDEQMHGTIHALLKSNPEAQDIVAVMTDMVLGQKGRNIAKLHDIVEARPHDPVALENLVRAVANHGELARTLGIGESAGARRLRLVQERSSLRTEEVSAGTEGAVKEVTEGAETVKGAKPPTEELPEVAGMKTRDASQVAVDEANAKFMGRLMKLTNGNPRDLDAAIKASIVVQKGGAMRAALEVFTNFILSGPQTWGTVLTSGQALSLFEPVVKMTAGAMGGNTAMIREGVDTLVGLYSHLGDNIKVAAMAMREGRSVINPAPTTYAIGGMTGKVIRSPGNIMMGLDEFTRVSNYRAHVRAQSLRMGREAGLEGASLARKVDADLRVAFDPETGIATIPESLKYAEVATLSGGLTPGFGRELQSFTNNALAAKFVVPFVRASSNIFDYAWQAAPGLNFFNKTSKEIMMKGGEEAAVLHARSLLATTAGMFAYTQAIQGSLTGRGPSDPDLRKLWLKDNQPYSIRVGNTWVSYNRLDPLATPIGLMADLHVIAQEQGEKHMDFENILYASTGALVANMASKTYLRGVMDFSDAWSKGDAKSVARYLQRQGSSVVVPNLVNKLNPDPYYREVDSMLDAIKGRMPYFSETLDPRHDIFGEKVLKADGVFNRGVNPFTTKAVTHSKAEEELLSIGKSLAPFADKLEGGLIDLHDKDAYVAKKGQPSPYVRLMELVRDPGHNQPSLREAMEKRINQPGWNDLSDGTSDFKGGRKLAILGGIKERYEQRAFHKVLQEYPKLAEHLKAVRKAKGGAMRSGEQGQQQAESVTGPIHK